MSRVVNLDLEEKAVKNKCLAADVGVSAIERLPQGGTRLVCMSSDGAALIRRKLKGHLIKDEVERARHRPVRPLW